MSIFATFLLTFYCTNESLDGLFGVLKHFRTIMGKWSVTAEIVGCPFCFSFWAGLAVALIQGGAWQQITINTLANAGAVCLMYWVAKSDILSNVSSMAYYVADYYQVMSEGKVEGDVMGYVGDE